jgi:hypothetical protein
MSTVSRKQAWTDFASELVMTHEVASCVSSVNASLCRRLT